METKTNPTKPVPQSFNRAAYVVFVLAGIYFLLFSQDASQGPLFLSLALVFDPFDVAQPWKARPTYQKIWLIVHLILSFASLAWLLFGTGN